MCYRIPFILACLLSEWTVGTALGSKACIILEYFLYLCDKDSFWVPSRTQGEVCGLDTLSHRETTVPQLIVLGWNVVLCSCYTTAALESLHRMHEELLVKYGWTKWKKKKYSKGDCFIFIFFLRKVETGLHICCRCFDKVASSWSPVADPRTVLFSLQRSSFWNLGLSISSWSPCSFCGRLLMFRINSWASSNSFSPISFFTRSFQALSFGWPSNTSRPVPTGWGTGLDWS